MSVSTQRVIKVTRIFTTPTSSSSPSQADGRVHPGTWLVCSSGMPPNGAYLTTYLPVSSRGGRWAKSSAKSSTHKQFGYLGTKNLLMLVPGWQWGRGAYVYVCNKRYTLSKDKLKSCGIQTILHDLRINQQHIFKVTNKLERDCQAKLGQQSPNSLN